MKKIKFVVQLGTMKHEVTEEFEDDVTGEELMNILEDWVWDEIDATYYEVET